MSDPVSVFCYADRDDGGKYKTVRIPSPDTGPGPTELWISNKLGQAQGRTGAERYAIFHAQDSAFAWAIATHVVDTPLADGRFHDFTHVVVAPRPADGRLLEYALLKAYDGSAGLFAFGNALYADPVRVGLFQDLAARVGELARPDVTPAPELSPRRPDPPTSARRPRRIVRLHASMFAVCACGALLGTTLALWLYAYVCAPEPTPVPLNIESVITP